MAQRPIPTGYYAMTEAELRSFVNSATPLGAQHTPIMVEIDGERFPVIKIVRGLGNALVLRVPQSALE